ncbi:MAG: hypothetical protein JXR11_11940 [Balneola sp.]
MKTRRTYLLRWVLFVFFLMFGYSLSYAQKKVAVDWEKPADSEAFNSELDFFSNHNVSYLFVNHPLTADEIVALDSAGILFFVKLDHKFVTENEFINNSDQYLESVNEAKAYYDSSSTFNGIVAFTHSNISQAYLGSQTYLSTEDFFEITGNKVYSVNIHSQPLFSVFEISNSYAESLSRLKKQLINSELILLLDGEWYRSVLAQNTDLKSTFEGTSGMYPTTIAVPDIPDQTPLIHWSVLVLVLLWISLAVNVASNPTYLETIPRYFTAHRFFVDDILSYRERSSASAVFLLFQHAIFGGLVVYILTKVFINDIGLEALYYHIPYIAIMGKNYFSLFVLSTLLVLIVEMIALFWLYFPNKEMSHFNQALNLFTWIFHLDFILITLIVTVYFSGQSTSFLASILAITYVLIWFSSFNITAFDASKRLGMHRNSYLFKTIGLHTLVSGALVVLLIVFNEWWDILKLAVSV